MPQKNQRNRKVQATTGNGKPFRFIFRSEVCARIGVTFPTIWDWMQRGQFPRARDVGGRPGWIESEINEWILNRPLRRYKGDEPNKPVRAYKPSARPVS